MLFVIVTSFLSMDARAQISGYPTLSRLDTSSFTDISPSIRMEHMGVLRIQAHRRQGPLMDANLTVQHLPFFCRQELKLEKLSGLPVRMRLGSVQQTDWLEQKVRTAGPW